MIKRISLQIFLLFFVSTTFSTFAKEAEKDKINLYQSFITFDSKNYSWRTSIQSVLLTKKNNYFLTKEIMAETNSERPFHNIERYLYLALVENKKISVFRTSILTKSKKNLSIYPNLISKKNIKFSKFKIISKEEITEILKKGERTIFYCSIKYNYKKISYELITICDYVNFNQKNNSYFLQPALGLVPFVDETNDYKSYGYVAVHQNKENEKLEFLLNEKTSIFSINIENNLIKKFLKKIFNGLSFFIKKNEFSRVIPIDNVQLSYFVYID